MKQGISLAAIEDVDSKLLTFLRETYGITTAEELVEAVSFSSKLEAKVAKATDNVGSFRFAVEEARRLLGSTVAEKLEKKRVRFHTGALKPSHRQR